MLSQWQNNIAFVRSWLVHVGYITSITDYAHWLIYVIFAGFEGIHFEFRVNQESKGCITVIIGFLIHTNMGLDTKILSLSLLETESI